MTAFFVAQDKETVHSQEKQDLELTVTHHQLLIEKFRLRLKKAGKTTRPARYDINQIPYEYAVELQNRLKTLDLVSSVPKELWMEVHDIVCEAANKAIPKKKKSKKAK